MKTKYYSLAEILKQDAHYNVIIGERSNGKTFACLRYGLEQYVRTGKQMAYLRRWQDDFTGKRGQTVFDGIVSAGIVEKLTEGRWTSVYYYAGRWYLCCYDDKQKRITDEKPFAYAFALTQMEHDKSTSYPDITTVVFDEFLTRNGYLNDEFVLFQNTLSTIIRDRDDVKIFMLGNTVNKYSPYFAEMGLTHLKDMQPGTIDKYYYGSEDHPLTVSVEFTGNAGRGKASDIYFAFDNPKLDVITGRNSIWEMAIYPHCPRKYTPKDVVFSYFLVFDGDTLQADVIRTEDCYFTFIHRKTTPIQDEDRDLIFSPAWDPRPNHRRRITSPTDKLGKLIYQHYLTDAVYYQSNDIGEIVRNYLAWSKQQAD